MGVFGIALRAACSLELQVMATSTAEVEHDSGSLSAIGCLSNTSPGECTEEASGAATLSSERDSDVADTSLADSAELREFPRVEQTKILLEWG